MTVSQIVTDIIIQKLENGFIPWVKPWSGGEAVNYVTQKPYTGINRLLLDGGEYATYKQITERGGKIKKGAKSHIVVFYKPLEVTDDETDEVKEIRLLRYYKVFSIKDVDGIEPKQTTTHTNNYSIEACEDIISRYTDKSGVKFETVPSAKAYYSPDADKVVVPLISQFTDSKHYYATVFHELAHSTGHKSRLNRLTATAHFGNGEYSREELTAEIASAMICRHTGIDTAELMNNTTAYIQSWLKALKNDVNMVLVASAKAEKAYKLITE